MPTAPHGLEEAHQSRVLEAVLAAANGPQFLLDDQDRILGASERFADLVGCERSALVGRTLEAVGIQVDGAAPNAAAARRSRPDGTTTAYWTLLRADRRALDLVVELFPIDGAPVIRCTVTRWDLADGHASPFSECEFKIASDPFGKVLSVGKATTLFATPVGSFCFQAIHQRVTPCPHCPGRPLLSAGETRAAITTGPGRSVALITAMRGSADVIHIDARLVDDGLVAQLTETMIAQRARDASLTPREFEVLKLIVEGAAPAEISRALALSLSTAKFHLANVLRKVGAESRSDLIRALFLTARPGPAAGTSPGDGRPGGKGASPRAPRSSKGSR